MSSIFDPITLGDLPLKNRVIMAPLTRARAGDSRMPNALMKDYYTQRAGAGMILTEATIFSDEGAGWVGSAAIETDAQAAAWKDIVDSVRAAGSTMFLQLWHTGRASHSSFHAGGALPVAPSAIKLNGEYIHTPKGKEDYEVPRALETDEIPRLIAQYKAAAERAKAAGFDGIEVHSANGYLLDSFLQSKTNHRDDQYGGSLENRFRLLSEILAAVTEVYPANRVGVRLSPNGNFNDMGSPDFRETFLYAAAELDKLGLAYLHVMDGLGFGFHELGEPITLADARSVFKGPIIGNCGYTLDSAQTAVGNGDADMIAFGRPFMANPDLVHRFQNGLPLNDLQPVETWYGGGAEGYTDYSTHSN